MQDEDCQKSDKENNNLKKKLKGTFTEERVRNTSSFPLQKSPSKKRTKGSVSTIRKEHDRSELQYYTFK